MPDAPASDILLASLLDLLHNIDTAIVTIDENHKVSACIVGVEMLGYTTQSIIGIDAGELVCALSRPVLLYNIQHLQPGQSQSFGFQHNAENGQLQRRSGTLHRPEGNSGWLWFVVRDDTKSLSQSIQSNSTDMKMAALRDLSGAMSHHLNNVIGSALTSIDYALDSQDEQRMQKTLYQASQLMVRAGSIISGLQVFAVGDQHSQDLRGFSDIIDDAIETLTDDFSAAQVQLKNETSSRIDIEVGAQQLTTVLRVLLKNAIEATPKGGTVRICTSAEPRWVVLHVMDKGCGIKAESLPHVFEPFWTTKEHYTSTAGEGTGLGLAMAHGIVTSIGGIIEIDSSEHQGTHVTVYWPIPDGA